jgi:SAM-dependent methyltransferase
MKSDWYKKYWQIGFATRLYDLLAPRAYLDCLKRCVELVPPNAKLIFDAGCGSGLLLNYLQGHLKPGCRYIGTDKIWSGASASVGKVRRSGTGDLIVQSDLLDGLALKENSVDVIFACFLVYAIGDSQKRNRLMRNLRHILKPGGKLILINPTQGYNAESIIRVSLEETRKRDGILYWLIKKMIVYPLTLKFGLRYVQNQLATGVWHAYSQDELCNEIREGGFEVKHIEQVYANSAYLVVAE